MQYDCLCLLCKGTIYLISVQTKKYHFYYLRKCNISVCILSTVSVHANKTSMWISNASQMFSYSKCLVECISQTQEKTLVCSHVLLRSVVQTGQQTQPPNYLHFREIQCYHFYIIPLQCPTY